MLDDIPGFLKSASDPWSEPASPEANAKDHFFQMINFQKRPAVFKGVSESLLLDEVGHRLALRLRKEPFNIRLLDLAVLWWRAWGDRREAFECVRHFLHWAGKTKTTPGALDVTSYAYVHASNMFLHGRRTEDAALFANMALEALPDDPLVVYLDATVKASSGMLDTASLSLGSFLKDHPRHPPARDLLHAIRCTQLRQEEAARGDSGLSSVTSELPGGIVEFYGEAKDLKVRLEALRKLLSGRRMNEMAQGDDPELWDELEEDEKRLAKLVEMQELAMKLKDDVEALSDLKNSPVSLELQNGDDAVSNADGSKSAKQKRGRRVIHSSDSDTDGTSVDGVAAATSPDQKVVVVEYPKSPSIPSLITAVAEMFSKKPDGSEPRKRLPFEEEQWPTDDDCKGIEEQRTLFMSTLMSVAVKDVDLRDHVDVDSDISSLSENFRPPICDGPVTGKPVHTLEHIEGMSKRATLSMPPEHALRDVFKRINEPMASASKTSAQLESNPPPLAIDEIGERTRLALKKNATDWVALNTAALYWRVEGNATQALECLRRAFYHSGSSQKDVSLVSIANVLHLSGHTIDAVTAMQMAIQVAPKMAINHFTMANILYTFGESSAQQAAFFYEATLRFQSEFHPALTRLLQLRCNSKKK
jgi:tetratricopeptide (TPR) repeat protein